MREWRWKDGTPDERADMIRMHYCKLDSSIVCRLFGLSESGLARIAGGDVWRSEYEAEPPTTTLLE